MTCGDRKRKWSMTSPPSLFTSSTKHPYFTAIFTTNLTVKRPGSQPLHVSRVVATCKYFAMYIGLFCPIHRSLLPYTYTSICQLAVCLCLCACCVCMYVCLRLCVCVCVCMCVCVCVCVCVCETNRRMWTSRSISSNKTSRSFTHIRLHI